MNSTCSTRQACADRKESEYLTFSILDRGLPDTDAQTARFILSVASKASIGRSVVVHRRMGVGRSALIAACVLIANGISADQIWDRLESAAGGAIPDTQEQKKWVTALPRLIQKG